jgi:hypothetical protein
MAAEMNDEEEIPKEVPVERTFPDMELAQTVFHLKSSPNDAVSLS